MREVRWHWLRLIWVAVVGLPLLISLASWPPYIQLVLRPCPGCPLTPAMASTLRAAGLGPAQWAAVNLTLSLAGPLAWAGVGLLVFLRRPTPGGLFMSALLLLAGCGLGGFASDLVNYAPEWRPANVAVQITSTTSFFALVLVLPNGRVAPRWTLWPILYLIGLNVANQLFPHSLVAFGNLPTPLSLAVFFVPLLISAAAIPLYRYRRVLTAAERQQFKWVAAGLVASVVALAALLGLAAACQQAGSGLACRVIQYSGAGLTVIFIPLSIGVAILRSHLWDIDVLIRRTLIYAVLTGLLALANFGTVIVLQKIPSALTGQAQSTLVTVLATLAIAALFGPLRRQVQAVIDQRFYRRKYDAAQTLADFGATLRDEVELEPLTQHLTSMVQSTMEPASVALWLKPANDAPRPRDAGQVGPP